MDAVLEHTPLATIDEIAAWFRHSAPGDCVRVSGTMYGSMSLVLRIANQLDGARRWERRRCTGTFWLVCIEPEYRS